MMLSWRSAAPTTASSPATEPVCARAACWPAGLAPTFSATIGLPGPVRLLRHPGELGRVADLLKEQADHPGRLVLDQVVEHVDRSHQALVAHRGEHAEPDGVRPGEAQHHAGQGAALQRDADRSGDQRRHQAQRIGRRPGMRVDEAQAVRTQHGDAVRYRAGEQCLLQPPAILAHLAVAGGEDHRVRDARRAHVVQHIPDRMDRHQDERQIGRLRQIAQARHDRQAERGPGPRMNGRQPSGETGRRAARDDEPGPPGVLGRTDQGDALGSEERAQPLRRDEFA